MNKLQEAIEKLLEKTDRDAMGDKLLQMLQQKDLELGSNPSDEEAEEAVKEVIKDHLLLVLRQKLSRPEEEEDEEEKWDSDMDENFQRVRQVFDEMDLHYRDYVHQPGVRAFELGVTAKGKHLRMKVYLEASPRVCRMDAIFPFQPEEVFLYPLCEKMLAENYPRRFGALQYDARDGELSYRYSFPITHGLHTDDFRTVFLAVIASAAASYDVIRQYAIGRFRRDARSEIICKAQNLIIELDQ